MCRLRFWTLCYRLLIFILGEFCVYEGLVFFFLCLLCSVILYVLFVVLLSLVNDYVETWGFFVFWGFRVVLLRFFNNDIVFETEYGIEVV